MGLFIRFGESKLISKSPMIWKIEIKLKHKLVGEGKRAGIGRVVMMMILVVIKIKKKIVG